MGKSIRLDGSVRRAFLFPDKPQEALAYYARPEHIFGLLPHIKLVARLAENTYRLLYSSTELNIYRVKLYCDL